MSLTSWQHLDRLLTHRIVPIMARELSNDSSIHLYRTGTRWVSFEQSAYRLQRHCPHDTHISPMRLTTYPYPIVMADIGESVLAELRRQYDVRHRDADYLVLASPACAGYDRWHRKTIRPLMAQP